MVADGLDYFAAPIFGCPVIGDILDCDKHVVLHNKEQIGNPVMTT
jgi:hypothetical protein